MGAINYKSNNIITLGYNIPKKEEEAEKEDGANYEALYYDDEMFNYEEVKNILKKYNFNFLDVKLAAGYYQGFYIDLDFDYIYFDNSKDKKEALKEATQLKKFLLEIIYFDMVSCFPGWCTTYRTEEETKKEIKEAIKQLKEKIKNTLTEKKYFEKYNFDGTLKNNNRMEG